MKKLFGIILMGLTAAIPASAASWMAGLPDDLPIRRMSLPGAHDAATSGCSGMSKCQSKDIAALWDSGVRVFDLRPSDNMTIYHGTTNTHVTMTQAMDILQDKLENDPQDFAILLVKDENVSNADTWASSINSLFESYDGKIAKFTPSITLGEARGKFVILSRKAISYSKAAFSEGWGDNQKDKQGWMYENSDKKVWEDQYLQDYYAIDRGDTDSKRTAIINMLDRASKNHFAKTWIINFASGYEKTIIGIASAENIEANAKTSNQTVLDYMKDKPNGRTGIILMDFACDDTYHGQELVDALIARNTAPLSNDMIVESFRESSNWVAGAASKGVGTSNKSNGKVIESYRDDSFQAGTVMYSECDGLENGDYIVSLMAHANWTPGRGSIQTSLTNDGDLGYSQCVINDRAIDLPIHHNTGFVDPVDTYTVPVKVENGKLKISIVNVRGGANWHTCYVNSISPVESGATVYSQDFENNFIGWSSTTGAQNQTLKGGPSELSGTKAYENWNSSAFSGKIYHRQTLPNGKYKVSLDVRTSVNDAPGKIYVFANGEKSTVNSTDIEGHELEVTVEDRLLEFGVGFDDNPTNWVGVDNAKVSLVSLTEDTSSNDLFCNPVYYFHNPENWEKGDAFEGGNLGLKDNLYVETWRGSASRPEGNVISSTQTGFPNGDYLLGAYIFSCRTGDQTEEDGSMDFATVTVNGAEFSIPTHNNGNIPEPHALFYLPAKITDGSLKVEINGKGYPNWFGIEVIALLPHETGTSLAIADLDTKHGYKIFKSDMDTSIQNVQINANAQSNNEKFFENWNPSAYSGRIFSHTYVPTGIYEVSLDCFAENIGSNLEDYQLFVNEVSTPKTQDNAFETLTVKATVPSQPKQSLPGMRRETSVASEGLHLLTYGFEAKSPVARWVAVKNPVLKFNDISTGIDEVEGVAEVNGDESVYSVTGVKVGNGAETLDTLAPGIYIYKGRKYIVR